MTTSFSVQGNPIDGYRLYYAGTRVETAEVHLHWDGARPAEKVFGWHRNKGNKLFLPDVDRNYKEIEYGSRSKEISSAEQLRQFWWNGWKVYDIGRLFSPTIDTMQTREDIIQSAREHVVEQAGEGKIYFETRFAPEFHTERLKIDQVVGYALEGLSLGIEDAIQLGNTTIPKLILCMFRQESPENGEKVAKVALQFQNDGVCGLDLACAEPGFPASLFFRAYELTFDSDVKRTVHVGEMCKAAEENLRNIEYCIEHLAPHGLGHAKDIYMRPDLMEKVSKRGIRIESNEVSNEWLRFIRQVGDASLDVLAASNVPVIVNSDDPVKWPHGSLAHCLYRAAQAYGDKFVKNVIANGVRYAFGLTDPQKADLTKRLESQFT